MTRKPDAIITIPIAHLMVYEGSIMRLARLIQRAAKNGDRMIIKRELKDLSLEKLRQVFM